MDFSQTLMVSPSAPGDARRSLDRLAGMLRPDRLDDVRLVVSELVTNTLVHSGRGQQGTVEMRVQLLPGRLRVEVTDQGREWGKSSSVERPEGGFGLLLVDHLAERWGHEGGDHTTVWAELAVP